MTESSRTQAPTTLLYICGTPPAPAEYSASTPSTTRRIATLVQGRWPTCFLGVY